MVDGMADGMVDDMALGSFEGGTALVIGATGGIGRAVAAGIEASDRFDRVIGLGRSTRPGLDVLDEASVAAAAGHVAALGELRLVFDATGALSKDGLVPEKSWRQIDPDAMARAFALNAIGPALLAKHLLPVFPRRGRAVFATLSARVGSITDNGLGGWYSYRASKAALNQIVRCAAIELARSRPDALCIALHPGTVDTGLSESFAKAGLEVQPPDLAAERMLAVIDGLTPADSGGFRDHLGQTIPW